MKQLYDTGYQTLRDIQLLLQVAVALDAVVMDIRQRPQSRDAQWNKGNLSKILGDHYRWLDKCGNANYKGDGPIDIPNLDGCLDEILSVLQQRPVILLCACWDRSICHRMVIVEKLEQRAEIQSIWLGRLQAEEILAQGFPPPPEQLPLF